MTFEMPDRETLERAAETVHAVMQPTPQYCWPLLSQRAGAEVWAKHENHTPIGAFKVRGGLVYMERLARERPEAGGIITATRGNHGQSVAFAARRYGLRSMVLVPHGNSVEKNASMKELGAELIEYGNDFQEARERAGELAESEKLDFLGPFQSELVAGVGTYSMEFFTACPDLDTVYVPIGMGSGICGAMAARDALGLKTKIVGVVAETAAAYKLSFDAGEPISTNSADTVADGLACRVPDPDALTEIRRGAERVVTVSDQQIEAAMRHYFTDTHNVVEGAGAAPLAALLAERSKMRGRKVGVIVTGGNIDLPVYRRILADAEAG